MKLQPIALNCIDQCSTAEPRGWQSSPGAWLTMVPISIDENAQPNSPQLSRSQIVRYPKYTTTVIGAHSVPRWYEALDRLVAVGQLSPQRFGGRAVARHPGRHPRPGDRGHRRHHRRRNAPAHAQPPCPAERDAEPFLAEDSVVPGRDPAEADHATRPECLSSGRDLPRTDRRHDRPRPGRRVQDGVGLCAQAGQDHHDRAAHAGSGRLRRVLQRHRRG